MVLCCTNWPDSGNLSSVLAVPTGLNLETYLGFYALPTGLVLDTLLWFYAVLTGLNLETYLWFYAVQLA